MFIDLVFLVKLKSVLKINRTILFFLLIILFGCTKKDTTDIDVSPSADSLSTYLSLANDDNLPYKYKQKYNQKAFSIIINQKDDSVNKVNLFKIANRYYNMSDWDSYQKTTELILDRSKKSNDSVNIAKAYMYLGDYYSSKLISDSAFMNYYRAEKIYSQINDQYNLAKTYFYKANLQFGEGDLFESEITVFKGLRVLKTLKKCK